MAEDLISSLQHDLKVSTSQGERKKLYVRNQPDPLLLSPLSFQTRCASPASLARSPAGRPLTQHGPNNYQYTNYQRRSLPPSDVASQCSTDSGCSSFTVADRPDGPVNRRRSLPPSIHSSVSSSRSSEAPSLWSLQEDSFHEPMDISPDKSQRSPSKPTVLKPDPPANPLALRRQGTGSGSTNLRNPNLQGIKRIEADRQSQRNESPRRKQKSREPVREEEDKENEKPVEEESKAGGRSWCGKFLIMLVQLALGAGVVIASMLGFDVFSYWCLHQRGINSTTLAQTLSDRVYGQHLAVQIIPAVFEQYSHQAELNEHPSLVLSFHGWTGIGKNHISFLISEELRSGQAHKIISTLHFPHADQDYAKALEDMIFPRLAKCKLNLFIVDEIDKAPDSVVQSLSSILQRVRTKEFGKDGYRVIFLLLSNTGASQINKYAFETLRNRQEPRETISHDDLVNVLLEAQNQEDFDWFSRLHRKGLIDVIVPFLPLERKHVEKCALADMRAKGIPVSDNTLESVLQEMTFVPADYPIFSASGCRRVRTKVDVTGPGL